MRFLKGAYRTDGAETVIRQIFRREFLDSADIILGALGDGRSLRCRLTVAGSGDLEHKRPGRCLSELIVAGCEF